MTESLSQEECLCYARQMLLPEMGETAQLALKNSSVVIIGVGGLGCTASIYLASAGVGQMMLVDFDKVSRSNLQRQILFTPKDLGLKKATQGAKALQAMVPDLQCPVMTNKVTQNNIDYVVQGADLVLDCTDNMHTRMLINQACKSASIPLVIGAAAGFNGQLLTLSMAEHTPCYQCLYPVVADDPKTCLQTGVLGPVVGMIGSMQALQGIKLLTKQPDCQHSQLHRFNGHSLQWQRLRLVADPSCPVCQMHTHNITPETDAQDLTYAN